MKLFGEKRLRKGGKMRVIWELEGATMMGEKIRRL